MVPSLIEEYECGNVQLRVYQWNDPLRNTYWLRAGVAGMEFDEIAWEQLRDLIHGWENEVGDSVSSSPPKRSFWQRIIGKE